MKDSYQFSEKFELFDIDVQRKTGIDLLHLIFEMEEDVEIEKHLIDFRKKDLEVHVTQNPKPDNPSNIVLIKSADFKLSVLKVRPLKNMEKLKLVLTCGYKKELELAAVKLRRENCQVNFNALQKELDID